VTEPTKHKSPEELGEAVGQKIEELFGSMFQDEAPAPPPPVPASQSAPVTSRAVTESPRRPIAGEPVRPTPIPKKAASPSLPISQEPLASTPNRPRPASIGKELGRPAKNFEELIEQIEAVVLNLEWEVGQKSVSDLTSKLGEVEKFIPGSGTTRNLLAMHNRVLARFNTPGAAPHPALIKLLQGSIAAWKSLHASRGKGPLPPALTEALTQSYRKIMSAPASELIVPRTPEGPQGGGVPQTLRGMINDLGNTVGSLEEVNQRLARIVGVLRQGGDMSGEEITRRLGTLENLLSQRVSYLSSFHKELANVAVSLGDRPAGEASRGHQASADGLLMLLWGGTPLAVPSSAVIAVFPLSRPQAEQFKDKSTITLGSRSIPRLPLKKPQSAEQPGTSVPGWLVHLAWDNKDFFLLADRSLGYRQTPGGVDLETQGKIKIGATLYTLLTPARFR
jgi:hypothetical protein